MRELFIKYELKTLIILTLIAVLTVMLSIMEAFSGTHDQIYITETLNWSFYGFLMRMLDLLPIYILSFFFIIENKTIKTVAYLGQLICVVSYVGFLGQRWGYSIIEFIQKYYDEQILIFGFVKNTLDNIYVYGKTSAYIISLILIIIYRSKILKGELFRE
ncbi:MAG: hypothetical protein JXR81_04430 [Candidatus Goldbacteria bacterium]|nr:hypothetical protein [Candidatus Goldiibacteriota bacterium]